MQTARIPTARPIRDIAIRKTSSSVPTLSDGHRDVGRSHSADRDVDGKEGAYGNAERRTQFWRQQVKAPGEAKSDLWQLVEFSKRLKTDDVWPADVLAANPSYKGKPCSKCSSPTARSTASRSSRPQRADNDESKALGYVQKGLFEEYTRALAAAMATIWHRSTCTTRRAACVGRWSMARRRCGASVKVTIPYVKAGEGVKFYGKPDGKAMIFALPYQPAAEMPDKDYDLWLCTGRVLEHWHSGSMTVACPSCTRRCRMRCCSCIRKTPRKARPQPQRRGQVQSRRGEIELRVETKGRNKPPVGLVFAPFFDEMRLVNKLTLDATCPISKETDYKKCAVRAG